MRRGAFRATRQFGHRRVILGLSQDDLARRAGVSQSMVSFVELGQKRASPPVAKALAKALGWSLGRAVSEGVFVFGETA